MNNVFISGGSRGIGAATVRLLRGRGVGVAFCYRESQAHAQRLAGETGALAVNADVSIFTELERAFAVVSRDMGFVDGLVINAGEGMFAQLCDVDDADFHRVVNTNLLGAINCAKLFSRGMISRKRGSIVIVSSIQGITGASCESVYAATKAALISLTKSLAAELGPCNIRVNCVAPGIVATDMNARLTPDELEAIREDIPLGRIGDPSDVARATAFLLSDDAAYISGAILRVDGGWRL